MTYRQKMIELYGGEEAYRTEMARRSALTKNRYLGFKMSGRATEAQKLSVKARLEKKKRKAKYEN